MKKILFSAIAMIAFSLNAQKLVSDPDEVTCATEAMEFGDEVESQTGSARAGYLATLDYYDNCMDGTKLILIN